MENETNKPIFGELNIRAFEIGMEAVDKLDKIRKEISEIYVGYRKGYEVMYDVMKILDKYGEAEDGQDTN